MVLASELFDRVQKYHENKREQNKELDIRKDLDELNNSWSTFRRAIYFIPNLAGELKLVGKLNLTGFKNLTKLDCNDNNLTTLDVSECRKLETLFCQNNKLISLELPSFSNIATLNIGNNRLNDYSIFKRLSSKKLVYLDIRDNAFPKKDLSFLRKFNKLNTLKLGRKKLNVEYLVKTGIDIHINTFDGSLKHLENMSQLHYLSICNTNINKGLKYLPDSLKEIKCGTTFNSNHYKCSDICNKLKSCLKEKKDTVYDLEIWRKKRQSGDSCKTPREKQREPNTVNILLIGSTSRKSNFYNLLVTGKRIVDEINVQFKEDEIEYNIVHTSEVNKQNMLWAAKKAVDLLEGGINRILFIVDDDDNFDAKKVYKMLKEDIFDDDVTDYITIIITCEQRERDTFKECDDIIYENSLKQNGNNRVELLRDLKNCDRVYIPENLKANLESLIAKVSGNLNANQLSEEGKKIIGEIEATRNAIIGEIRTLHNDLISLKNEDLATRNLEACVSLIDSAVKVATFVGCIIQ